MIIEGRASYAYEWNYKPDPQKLNGRAVSPWVIDSYGAIDRSNGEAKNVLTPGMVRVSLDLLLFGKTYLEVSAGTMIRTQTIKWFYTDDVNSSTFSTPTPITSTKLPQWPVTQVDPFWAVGLRF